MMIAKLITPENVAYAIIGLGMIAMILNKFFNFVHFGNNKSCPDPECQKTVVELGKTVAVIKNDMTHVKNGQDKLWKKVDEVGKGVSFIKGWIENNGTNK
jgi:hypothetical protein